MDLAPKARLKNQVIGIDHIAHLHGVIMAGRSDPQRQIGPVIDGEILGTGGDRVPLGSGPLLPDAVREIQKGAELLPARGEPLTHQ